MLLKMAIFLLAKLASSAKKSIEKLALLKSTGPWNSALLKKTALLTFMAEKLAFSLL
jgi:hypothetical protein